VLATEAWSLLQQAAEKEMPVEQPEVGDALQTEAEWMPVLIFCDEEQATL
jgi:hypothetical protein